MKLTKTNKQLKYLSVFFSIFKHCVFIFVLFSYVELQTVIFFIKVESLKANINSFIVEKINLKLKVQCISLNLNILSLYFVLPF